MSVAVSHQGTAKRPSCACVRYRKLKSLISVCLCYSYAANGGRLIGDSLNFSRARWVTPQVLTSSITPQRRRVWPIKNCCVSARCFRWKFHLWLTSDSSQAKNPCCAVCVGLNWSATMYRRHVLIYKTWRVPRKMSRARLVRRMQIAEKLTRWE